MLVKEEIKKIAIFRALQLGDMLCAVPAIRSLRHAFPDAEISLIGLPWAASFTKRFHRYFDRHISFPGYPGLPEQEVNAAAVVAFLSAIQKESFDLFLQMQGNGTIVNNMISLFACRHYAGFTLPDIFNPEPENFIHYPERIHEIDRHLKLMAHLGIKDVGREMEFPITEEDNESLKNANLHLTPGKYVCIHPGSRGAWRQWPTEFFAELGDKCVENGMTVVLTGVKDEINIVEAVSHKMQSDAVIAAGKTSLGAVAALLRDSFGLISNCTGVSHIAAALKTKSVVISMDGEPERWAPLNTHLHRTIDWMRHPEFELVAAATEEMLSNR
jgi:ADP-heptose:LPS heptosyltransferase